MSARNALSRNGFVFQKENAFPIEVKAEENLRAKSLSTILKANTEITGIRFSMSDYREQERMVNVPLYLAFWYFEWV